jgi:NAD(P)-dependent dehydrogenase (short-subunit alcohol dehydrogenase family)
MRLANQVALITGAAQGIGAAIARAFADEGALVAAVDLQEDPVAALAEELNAVGHRAMGRRYDVSQTNQIESLLDEVETELGPVTILVNSAGICPTHPFFEVDEKTLRQVLDINFIGPFFLMQAVAKRMLPRKAGAIINLASISGFLPKLEQLEYGASKAAVVSVTRSAAASLGPSGIRVNAIAPGVIETPLTKQIADQRAAIRGVPASETLRPVIEATPLRRMGLAEEVAAMAVFLASDESSFVTGQTFDVCGGQLMR